MGEVGETRPRCRVVSSTVPFWPRLPPVGSRRNHPPPRANERAMAIAPRRRIEFLDLVICVHLRREWSLGRAGLCCMKAKINARHERSRDLAASVELGQSTQGGRRSATLTLRCPREAPRPDRSADSDVLLPRIRGRHRTSEQMLAAPVSTTTRFLPCCDPSSPSRRPAPVLPRSSQPPSTPRARRCRHRPPP
jgi:hypothetical protein